MIGNQVNGHNLNPKNLDADGKLYMVVHLTTHPCVGRSTTAASLSSEIFRYTAVF